MDKSNEVKQIIKFVNDNYPFIEVDEDSVLHYMEHNNLDVHAMKNILKCADKFLFLKDEAYVKQKKYVLLKADFVKSSFLEREKKDLILFFYIDYEVVKKYFFDKNFASPGDEHRVRRKLDAMRDYFITCVLEHTYDNVFAVDVVFEFD